MKNKILNCITIFALVLSLFIFTACEEKNNDKEISSDVSSNEEKISERDALRLLEEYYDIAESMYFLCFDELDIDYGDDSENVSKYKINNYEEIMQKYFTTEFAKDFVPALLIEEAGQYYVGFGGFAEYYEDLRFEDVQIEKNKISCVISLDIWIPDEKIEDDVNSDFTLVRENGKWKIDEFTSYNQRLLRK